MTLTHDDNILDVTKSCKDDPFFNNQKEGQYVQKTYSDGYIYYIHVY